MRFENIMIDLETLGTKPGSVILSLGAVGFNLPSDAAYIEDTPLPTYYKAFDLVDTAKHAFTGDLDTIRWWMGQSEEARQLFKENGRTIGFILQDFKVWITHLSSDSYNIKIWGNGSDFDNALLTAYYLECKIPLPWKFWNNRCYRTAKHLLNLPKLTREGVHHNALDDAMYQVKTLLAGFPTSQLPADATPPT